MIAGTYSITYSAPGYTSKTITGVALANGVATVRNIQLAPAAAPDAQFTGSLSNPCSATAQFTNTSAASTSFMWYFGDGTTSTQTNPTHTYTANGTYTVKLKAYNCKGGDSLIRTNYITINMATPPVGTNGSHCGQGTVSLSASGSGTLNWYDAASGGNLMGTGTTFTTPNISNTTTYYVGSATAMPNEYVGKTDTAGADLLQTNNSYYLIFDCYTPVILKSVKVYASTAGNRIIELRASNGTTVLQTTTINVPAGESRITLNFNIPVGTGMSLRCGTTIPNMLRNSTGITFPYTLPGKISITGTNASTTRYYFFYDWEIETPNGCMSSLVPVTASILTVPVAAFSSSGATNTIDFTNASTGATSYQWTFGDGGNSTQTNPSHTYATNGTYTVTLISLNGSCSDTTTHDVTITTVGGVEDKTFAGVNLFPNPSKDNVTITFGSFINKPFSVQLFTLTGALVYKNNYQQGGEPIVIDLSAFAEGIYDLVLLSESSQMHLKVVKIK
jgi:PKD repeat protein